MYTEAQQYTHYYQMLAITGTVLNRFTHSGMVILQKVTGYYVHGHAYNTLAAAQHAIDTIHKPLK